MLTTFFRLRQSFAGTIQDVTAMLVMMAFLFTAFVWIGGF